ncbi:ribosome recycling factor [Candidatus Parcubacteria bacterium]|nr:MAG: ribosome recycling factor [Candidatus Parcubacteria bacterium]
MIENYQPKFKKVIEHLQKELAGIRTGQASPALVENIQVEAYGATQPIKALASINIPDARTIQIEIWDSSVVKAMEKALIEAELGMQPNVDGNKIRLNIPMMTDEQRQKFVKILKEKLEEARVAIRQIREEVKKAINKQEGVGDDEKRRQLDNLETDVKDQINIIDEMGKKKEEEITTI